MSHVIMMCGVSGSGKTTYAKKMEEQGYIRLSIDEEMWEQFGMRGRDYPVSQYDSLSKKAEQTLQERMIRYLRKGKDIVIDFSFWNKEKREFYRRLIEKEGATIELVYMKASKDVLAKRLKIRNQNIHANSAYVITDEILDKYYDNFQEPIGEGEKVILQK